MDTLRQSLELLSIALRSIDDPDPIVRRDCRAAAWVHLAEAQANLGDLRGVAESIDQARALALVWSREAAGLPCTGTCCEDSGPHG